MTLNRIGGTAHYDDGLLILPWETDKIWAISAMRLPDQAARAHSNALITGLPSKSAGTGTSSNHSAVAAVS